MLAARPFMTAFMLALASVALVPALTACRHAKTPTPAWREANAAWTGSGLWDECALEGYTIHNNVWGKGAGKQTLWVNKADDWGVRADHPKTPGVKAYPNCERVVGKRLAQLTLLKSSYDGVSPEAGAYAMAYDIWCDDGSREVMIWTRWRDVQPIAAAYSKRGKALPSLKGVKIAGRKWDYYEGKNDKNAVFSFLPRGQADSGEIDLKAVLDWLRVHGRLGDAWVEKAQFGWEITASPGGLPFVVRKFSVDVK
jgi:hypothetical protein